MRITSDCPASVVRSNLTIGIEGVCLFPCQSTPKPWKPTLQHAKAKPAWPQHNSRARSGFGACATNGAFPGVGLACGPEEGPKDTVVDPGLVSFWTGFFEPLTRSGGRTGICGGNSRPTPFAGRPHLTRANERLAVGLVGLLSFSSLNPETNSVLVSCSRVGQFLGCT